MHTMITRLPTGVEYEVVPDVVISTKTVIEISATILAKCNVR